MDSIVKTFEYDNGEIQRIHMVTLDKGTGLSFFKPKKSDKAFERICTLYRTFTVPRLPLIFGRLMHFSLPQNIEIPQKVLEVYESFEDKHGLVFEDLSKVAVAFREGLRIKKDGSVESRKNVDKSGAVLAFYEYLKSRGFASVVCGKLPYNKILPVSNDFGLISESEQDAELRCNSTFFIMDSFDVASVYDIIGTPIGLTAENGRILTPPLYEREAFVVKKDGSISIERPSLKDIKVNIGDLSFKDGEDGVTFYERPKNSKTPAASKEKTLELVVIGKKIAAVKQGGNTVIPASGFVISIRGTGLKYKELLNDRERALQLTGAEIGLTGLEEVDFAVSAGNSIIVNGEKTLEFRSKFYNIKRPWRPKYPPSLYPLDFKKARAPRMALGAKKDGSLVIVWAEGKSKFNYEPGVESCGASLSEMAGICAELGLYNAVHLDGGGSAQIILNGKRSLMISDRNKADKTEAERAVPLGPRTVR